MGKKYGGIPYDKGNFNTCPLNNQLILKIPFPKLKYFKISRFPFTKFCSLIFKIFNILPSNIISDKIKLPRYYRIIL
jgi:hypothetical protein